MNSKNIINIQSKIIREHEENLFKILYECKCCDEHNKNKPVSLYSGHMGHMGHMGHSKLSNKECKCPCRHTMREMSRLRNHNPWFSINKSENKSVSVSVSESENKRPKVKQETGWIFDRPGWHNY